MLENSWSVHFGMENCEKPVQKRKKRRNRSDKIGRLKYNQQLLKQILNRQEHIELMLRTIFKGLEGMFHFEKPFLQKIACADEVDQEILEMLYQNQPNGLFPKDVAGFMPYKFKLNRFQVLRRIKAMNRRLEKELGQRVAEKRGHHWALTSFAVEVWGEAEKGEEQ
jgi:hypothetical protein